MIISRTPCRMSFVGGGTDLAAHYSRYGGAVISTSINKYINVVVNHKFDDRVRVGYSKTENCNSVEEIQHPIVRECLRMLGVSRGIEIVSLADIPANGTGLGSSSTFTVGLLHALHAHLGRQPTKHQLSRDSCYIEIEACKEPIGKQDQYAAAFGGLNFIRFNTDHTVDVEPLDCSEEVLVRIESCILTFYTGIQRSAGDILREQSRVIDSGSKTAVLQEMVQLAENLRAELRRGNADAIGTAMHQGWSLKRSISDNISSNNIDDWHARGIRAGALGGKILGAGAGGFLVFYVPPELQSDVRDALNELTPVKLGLDRDGSKIIFRDHGHM